MIMVIPMEGAIHVYDPSTLPLPFRQDGAVKVNLTLDGKQVGSVTFATGAPVTNARATEATFLLTGAYVRVQGEAMFDIVDEETLTQVVAAL